LVRPTLRARPSPLFPARDRASFDAHWERNILGNPGAITQPILVNGEQVASLVDLLGAIEERASDLDVDFVTLIHGDLHGGNLFVMADGRVALLDSSRSAWAPRWR